MIEVAIIGGGGHARNLVELIQSENLGFRIIGYVAPFESITSEDIKYLGTDSLFTTSYSPETITLVNGIGYVGDKNYRREVYEYYKKQDFRFESVISKTADIASTVTIGEGVQILKRCIINNQAYIGENSLINTNTVIEHDSQIESHVHIAPCVCVLGNVQIKDEVFVGAHATILPGVVLGRGCLIGAQTLVNQSVSNNMLVVGSPGRVIRCLKN